MDNHNACLPNNETIRIIKLAKARDNSVSSNKIIGLISQHTNKPVSDGIRNLIQMSLVKIASTLKILELN
jgi:hypothetical protein